MQVPPKSQQCLFLHSLPHSPLFHPGFNPYWGQTLCFQLLVPELAMLRFLVKDYNWTSRNDFIGQYTLPWTCMQQGEHVLPPLAKPLLWLPS